MKKEYPMRTRGLIVVLAIAVICAIASPGVAKKLSGIVLPNSLSASGEKLILNGAGVRSKFFIDIYPCGLYLKAKSGDAKKIIDADEVMAIRMHIVSGLVTSDKMQRSIDEGFEKSTRGKTGPIKSRKDKMIKIFQDGINKNDVYDLTYQPGKGTSISKNGKVKVTLRGLDFKKALFGIWLSDNPISSSLKKKMLGN